MAVALWIWIVVFIVLCPVSIWGEYVHEKWCRRNGHNIESHYVVAFLMALAWPICLAYLIVDMCMSNGD